MYVGSFHPDVVIITDCPSKMFDNLRTFYEGFVNTKNTALPLQEERHGKDHWIWYAPRTSRVTEAAGAPEGAGSASFTVT